MASRRSIESPVEMEGVARAENVDPGALASLVKSGRVVIPFNTRHKGVRPKAIGEGMTVKVNANIGTSRDVIDVDLELEKVGTAIAFGADAVMDLSTGGDIGEIRRRIIAACDLPIGTVPVYEAICQSTRKGGPLEMTEDDLFRVIEEHARDGVDFMTLHCGVTSESVRVLRKANRLTGVVSRGGAMLSAWMHENELENPLFENYDHLLDLARDYGFAISLGDGLRPGSIADATDAPQIKELMIMGQLVERARYGGVQAMVEGPGHVPLDQIETNVRLEKAVCKGAPFYVLGPLVCDVAAGYDHIAGAIGGALAAYHGADFLCYVTPSEHLSLPTVDDVKEGVVASRIAAHAADIARGRSRDWDDDMSAARKAFDWEKMFQLCVDPAKAREYRRRKGKEGSETCSMCGELCAMKIVDGLLRD
ncbi:MAG: phosphomethylpyrimidine synthase ThiC [Methanobacteriota archaeon]|nr:MAG: phosphomethylpyrimidine synthase ThiC [Euryarchaeota archaeon]